MQPIPVFPPRRPRPLTTIRSFLWGIVTGLFDYRWLLGMPPACVEQPAPQGATVTLLVPAHNEAGHLRSAIEALLKQTHRPYSIIIVNDGSKDGTDVIARELAREHPGLIFDIHTTGTGSKAGALNAGLDSDCPFGELTVVMDADTQFASDAIEKVLPNFFDPHVGLLCWTVMPQEPERRSLWWRSKLVEYVLGQGLTKEAQNHFGAILVSAGCCSMYYTPLLMERRFSSATMAEDMEIAWLMQMEGWRAVYAPDGLCFAAEPETRDIYRKQRERWLRGFLQCYELYKWRLWRCDMRLALVVNYMYVIALIGMVLVPLGIYLFVRNPALAVLLPAGVDVSVMALALAWYSYRFGGVKLIPSSLASIPAALCGIYYNWGVLLHSLKEERIFKRRLTTWFSGHGQGAVPAHVLTVPTNTKGDTQC